ncbi:FitA-like ribbon-helix-helix domain-containing protein [Actinomyces slackii]|uniref:Antitoxin FitA-like ribbon-helix-helix domain-containing protein n=1 Tax=Actinomyces slackii TaxID=52774 RepID=A0A448KA73_9ACTO|nr:hypothetical protein [Actinomyces slackii]VEG73820.1 Uncharacterised protein [Actinomyces slackii]
MATTLQIRHVPEDVSARLKARAALQGLSLSDYLLAEVTRLAERPDRAELLASIRAAGPAGTTPAVEVLRASRQDRA